MTYGIVTERSAGSDSGLRIIVCGGREFADQALLFGVLDMVGEADPIETIIQGGANGADHLARMWCATRYCRCENFPANWHKHGRAAGPIRNRQMIEEGRPNLVIAFPGGRGTADMVRQARTSSVEVMEIPA